jgi:hypothetical protein
MMLSNQSDMFLTVQKAGKFPMAFDVTTTLMAFSVFCNRDRENIRFSQKESGSAKLAG